MKKITLYKKGGKLYYKKGGKMCLYQGGGPIRYRKKAKNTLNTYQNSGTIGFDDNPSFSSQYGNNDYNITQKNPYSNNTVLDQSAGKKKNSYNNTMGQISNYANIAGAGLSMIPKEETTFGGTDIGKSAFGRSHGTTGDVRGFMDSTSSAVPVWGAIANATRGLTDTIDQKDEYGVSKSGVGAFFGNAMSPSKSITESIGIGQDYGAGSGIANFLTFGLSGKAQKEATRGKVEAENDWLDNRKSQFDTSQNTNQNYAKDGKDIRITPYNSINNPNIEYNAEVENGEIIIGDGISSLQHGGNSTSSMVSPYAVKLSGDKHSQDSDGDGQYGIPVKAQEGMYVASNYLGLNGKKARKGQKTVAKSMEPLVESLAMAEKGGDVYNTNPELVKHQLAELEVMKNEAEKNKAAEELKKMLSKKDRNMAEISQFIQENAEYLMPQQTPQQQEGPLPEMAQGQQQMAQTGGKLQGPIRNDLKQHATDELGVPQSMVDQAQDVDPGKIAFADPGAYTGQSGQEYETESSINDQVIPASEAEEFIVEDTDEYTDSREGATADETTLGERAGKSEYTGTSNLIQEKMQEVLGPKMKSGQVFSEDGGLHPDVIEKGVKEGIPRKALMDATRKSITDGQVGSWLGIKMQDAIGVRTLGGKNKVDPAVSGRSQNLYNNEELNWAENIRQKIEDNEGIVPSEYTDLPEDLLTQLTNLARSGKQAHEGTFGTSLSNSFREANTRGTEEIDRQEAVTYKSGEEEGDRIDRNTDLSTDERAGNIKSFGDAFKFANKSDDLADEPFFTYKGHTYSKKTRTEDPELAKASDAAAIAGEREIQPERQTTIKNQTINKEVMNPNSRLSKIMRKKRGGPMRYRNGGLTQYQSGDPIELSKIQQLPPQFHTWPKQAQIQFLNQTAKTNPELARQWAAEYQQNNKVKMVNGVPTNVPNSRTVVTDNTQAGFDARNLAADKQRQIDAQNLNKAVTDPTSIHTSSKRLPDAGQTGVRTVGNTEYNQPIKKDYNNPSIKMNGGYTNGMNYNYSAAGMVQPIYQAGGETGWTNDLAHSTVFQEGGMMPGQEQEMQPGAESNAHAQQLMGEEGQAPMEGDPNAQPEQGGQVPPQIAQLAPEVQQVFMQLPPEAQEQILQLPPEQMEVAIMTIAQQMQQQQGGGQPQQGGQQQGPGSQVPQGVVDQMG